MTRMFGAALAAWMTLAGTAQGEDAQCLLDLPAEQLVDALVEMGPAERYFSRASHLRQAVLAERIAPGASETILDVEIAMSSGDHRLTVLQPVIDLMAAGKWDAATKAVRETEDPDVARAAKRLLPLVVELSGDYERLDEIYPYGDDTYSQNLNLSDAWRTALEAGRATQAVDLFDAHSFGNHTGRGYDDLMGELTAMGADAQAARLTGIVEAGLAAYEIEGGLSLCLEKRSLEECRREVAARPGMARLEQFDSGRYTDCFLKHREAGKPAACLADLRAEADAAGFEIDPDLPPVDGITGPVRLSLWGWQAMIGTPEPAAVPDAVFRETGHEVMALHGRMIAALLHAGDDTALGVYLDRIASPQGHASPSMIDLLTGAPSPDLERNVDWWVMAHAARHGDVEALERVVRRPEAGQDARNAARYLLDGLYRRRGDAEGALAIARLRGTTPDVVLEHAQQALAAGQAELAEALEAEVRARVCDQPEQPAEVRRILIERLLMARAVAAGHAPETLLHH